MAAEEARRHQSWITRIAEGRSCTIATLASRQNYPGLFRQRRHEESCHSEDKFRLIQTKHHASCAASS